MNFETDADTTTNFFGKFVMKVHCALSEYLALIFEAILVGVVVVTWLHQEQN